MAMILKRIIVRNMKYFNNEVETTCNLLSNFVYFFFLNFCCFLLETV